MTDEDLLASLDERLDAALDDLEDEDATDADVRHEIRNAKQLVTALKSRST